MGSKITTSAYVEKSIAERSYRDNDMAFVDAYRSDGGNSSPLKYFVCALISFGLTIATQNGYILFLSFVGQLAFLHIIRNPPVDDIEKRRRKVITLKMEARDKRRKQRNREREIALRSEKEKSVGDNDCERYSRISIPAVKRERNEGSKFKERCEARNAKRASSKAVSNKAVDESDSKIERAKAPANLGKALDF